MTDEQAPKNELSRFVVLFLLLVTTVLSAVLAGLQSDASIRADRANIQSQYYAVLASAEIFREGQQSAFDLDTLTAYLRHTQESTVLQFSALELENKGEPEGAAALRSQADILSARAESVKQMSLILNDPRYAPAAGAIPDLQTYLSDQFQTAQELTNKQNAAADTYHRWDDKSDRYLTILSALALVFFLLGVAQNARRLRVFFTITALVILSVCGFLILWALVS